MDARSHSEHSVRILITGISGLVGAAAARALSAAGHEIVGLDRHPPEFPLPASFVHGDLRDPAVARDACGGVDAVVHSAAVQYHDGIPRRRRKARFAENVEAARVLAMAARAARLRVICFLSSDMVYGLPAGRPLREADALRPIGPYGRSKVACEALLAAVREDGARVVILRPRLIVGPGRLGVLRRLFDRIRDGRSVPMIGAGGGRYQMVSVDDVVRAVCRALDSDADGVFNLGSQAPPTVRELLTDLIRRAGSKSRLVALPGPPVLAALGLLDLVGLSPLAPEQYRLAPTDYMLDTSRAAAELGWRSRDCDAEMLWQAYSAYALDRCNVVVARSEMPASIAAPSDARAVRAPTGERL